MKRRDFLFTASSSVALVVTGCGGSGGASSATPAPPGSNPPPPGPPPPPPPPTPGTPAGSGLPVLSLHASQSGRQPYFAAVYPLEGSVPSGQVLESGDDLSLRSSVLSAWPDGSAQVVVVAGETTVTGGTSQSLRLRASAPQGAALTPSAISAAVSEVSVNFGPGPQALKSFAAPDWIWWSNAQVICARYRLPCGLGALEAVIDIHAFASGRAFVEIVIENGRIDAGASSVTAPAAENYLNAAIAVNGATVATVSSPSAGMTIPNARKPGSYVGGHEAFRAWYCSTWVGGDPGIEVTHDADSLQGHPWFFRAAETSSEALSAKYAQTHDRYVPWATCRLRLPGMAAGGDDEQIALLTEEQADYVLSGDRNASRAVIATGLACHTANIHWRHNSGRIPTRSQMVGKTTAGGSGNGKWPETQTVTGPCWGAETGSTVDGSHVPFVGVVPFLCRPSPCFIEIAQKEFCWHATNYNSTDAATHAFDQARSRGWRLRNYAGAIFLTPDADYDGTGRKESLRAALAATVPVHDAFLNKSWNTLKMFYAHAATGQTNDVYPAPGNDASPWMHQFIVMSWIAVEGVKVLRGAGQTAWAAMCDRFVDYPVRYITQATAGEWRLMAYTQYMGAPSGADTTDMGIGDFGERNRIVYGPAVPTASGPWLLDPTSTRASNWSAATPVDTTPNWNGNSYNYDAIFWFALCAAVERGVSGADAAWAKVVTNGGITNLATWQRGFRTYPRFNRWPRNKPK